VTPPLGPVNGMRLHTLDHFQEVKQKLQELSRESTMSFFPHTNQCGPFYVFKHPSILSYLIHFLEAKNEKGYNFLNDNLIDYCKSI
jgi:hypothetical protein